MSCQKAIAKAGATFVQKKLKSLGTCTNAVLACVQTDPGDQGCLAKARTRCSAKLASIAAAADKLATTVGTKCRRDPLDFDELLSAAGLDYQSRDAECQAAFGIPLTGLDALAECLVRKHGCESDQLFDLQQARARELLTLANVPLDALPCLPDHGGGGDVNDPNETGKTVVRCTGAVNAIATRFASKNLKSLEKCVGRLFKCAQTRPGDLACLRRVDLACDTAFASIATAATKSEAAVAKKCVAISFELLRTIDGANIDALAQECARHDVLSLDSLEDYERCLFRQHECHAETLLADEIPRANELLSLLVPPVVLQSVFCPAVTGPAVDGGP